MKISVGSDGRILSAGPNKQAKALGEALNADREAADLINKMATNAEFLEACKKAEEFNAAYTKNPTAAVQRFSYLLEDGHHYQAVFSFQNSRIDADVNYI